MNPEDPACDEMPQRDLDWLDLVHAPLLAVGADGRCVLRANPSAVDLLGCNRAGDDLSRLLGDYSVSRLTPLIHDRAAGGEVVVHCRVPKGLATLGFRATPLPGAAGTLLTLADHGAERPCGPDFALMLEDIVRSLPVGVEIYDGALHEQFCNAVSDQLFGYDYDGATAHHDDWFPKAFPDPEECALRVAEWHSHFDAARADQTAIRKTEWEVVCRDGERRMVQFRFRCIRDTYVVVFWDITERRRLEEELRQLARTDELTGLYNRRYFFQAAERLMPGSRQPYETLSLLMLDVDHFKEINDTFGHGIGDGVLTEIARRCRLAVRPGDLVARLGGEEFAVLLPSSGPKAAEGIAHRLLTAIRSEPVRIAGATVTVEASIGCTWSAPADAGIDAVLERADRALYAAKAEGRNRVVIFAPPFAAPGQA